jgi:signal recognition particle receptor subunit alpha
VSEGGLILWSRSFTPAFSALALTPASPVNALIKEAFIEGQARGEKEGFEKDGYSVEWTLENSLGLVFVVSSTLSNTANTVIIGGVRSS